MNRILTFAAALFLFATAAGAQSSPLVDSLAALNKAGKWAVAAQFARRSLPSAKTLEEQCGLRGGMVYALARYGLSGPALEELRSYDAQCAGTAALKTHAKDIDSIRADIVPPPLPTTGFDFGGVDLFWPVVDTLSRGLKPSEGAWRALQRSAGNQMADQSTRRAMEVVFTPSRRAEFDSLSKLDTEFAGQVGYLARVGTMRPRLIALRDSLGRSHDVSAAVREAAKYLPRGTTESRPAPLVAFAFFGPDGYAQDDGIVTDLLYVEDNGIFSILPHEFHHVYLSRITLVQSPPRDSADERLVTTLIKMRNEGLADLIDKPHPYVAATPDGATYAKNYNAAYARTPRVVHLIDSLVAVPATTPAATRKLGAQIASILPSNGHPNGAYVAREILETFGADSLVPAVYSPFAFLRTFAAAEKARGNPPPFSPEALRVFDGLERKYSKK